MIERGQLARVLRLRILSEMGVTNSICKIYAGSIVLVIDSYTRIDVSSVIVMYTVLYMGRLFLLDDCDYQFNQITKQTLKQL